MNSMRPWIITLPLLCIATGCNSASTTTADATANTTANASAAPTVQTFDTEAETKETKAAPKETKEAPKDGKASKAPDPAYTVVDEGAKFGSDPQYASLVKALEHVKVPPPAEGMKTPDKAKVEIVTSKGTITVELNGKEAPLHTKSFLHLSKLGFFDSTIFHRYEPGFVIQGGDPLTKVPTTREFGGMGGPGYQIPRENNALKHSEMVLAAARSNDPNSAGSQFYFTLAPAPFLDDPPGYTVFGKVLTGKDVVLKLRKGDALKKVTVK